MLMVIDDNNDELAKLNVDRKMGYLTNSTRFFGKVELTDKLLAARVQLSNDFLNEAFKKYTQMTGSMEARNERLDQLVDQEYERAKLDIAMCPANTIDNRSGNIK